MSITKVEISLKDAKSVIYFIDIPANADVLSFVILSKAREYRLHILDGRQSQTQDQFYDVNSSGNEFTGIVKIP